MSATQALEHPQEREPHTPTTRTATQPAADSQASLAARAVGTVRKYAKSRDPWLDNARLLAAILIALMHVASTAGLVSNRDSMIYSLWLVTYPVRVPLFVLVAGYFSTAAPLSGRHAVNLLRNILGVYVCAWAFVAITDGLMGKGWDITPQIPPFALWFLVSLFAWRLLLPLVAHVRFLPVIAVVASLMIGFADGIGVAFSASRSFALFPVFLLGWYLRRSGARALVDHRLARPIGLAVFLAISVLAVTVGRIPEKWQYAMARGYVGSPSEQLVMAVERAGILALGVVGALAALALVPRGRIPMITYLGSGSMYIYILHALVLRQSPLIHQEWFSAITGYGPVLLLFASTVLACLALASRPVRTALGWLIQPTYTWLFREPPLTPSLSAARTPGDASGVSPKSTPATPPTEPRAHP